MMAKMARFAFSASSSLIRGGWFFSYFILTKILAIQDAGQARILI